VKHEVSLPDCCAVLFQARAEGCSAFARVSKKIGKTFLTRQGIEMRNLAHRIPQPSLTETCPFCDKPDPDKPASFGYRKMGLLSEQKKRGYLFVCRDHRAEAEKRKGKE